MTARLVLLAFALVPLAAAAQAPSPLTVALRDADGDRVPDGLGAVVTVEGWASADAGAFGAKGPSFYVEDAGGGVAVALADRADRSVHAGDPVRVTGTLAFVYGVAVLEDAHAARRPGPPHALVPARYDPGAPEALEGRLVEIEGVVVGKSRVEVGRALSLSLDDGSVLVAFGYFESPDLFETDPYAVGDRVRVTGVAGQYDRVAPFDGSYQIYPRTASDVRRAGIPMGVYRRAVLIALGLLGLAVVWVTALRRQVQGRVDQLRVSEERYRTVVDLASDAIVIHDLQGEHAELNRAAREAIGCDAAAPPPPLLTRVDRRDHGALREHAARLQQRGWSRTEVHVLCPGGPRLFEVDSRLVVLDDAPLVLSLARDVSVRREYERGLVEAREQAEETARIKSSFLASMSHEIRTPLTAVIGFADLLRYEGADDQLDLVLAIEAGGTRLLNTLNSVLDLAQLDAGGTTLRPQLLDLVAHLEESLTVLRPHAEGRGLQIHFAPGAATLPATVDAGAFDRILTNLVGNAIKFTDEGGITVSLAVDGPDVVVAVADTGVGIDAEFLPDLFSEFRQESEGHGRSHEGSGLGLAITRRLVDLMGGTVSVESEKGVGSTFTVRVPRGATGPPCEAEACASLPPELEFSGDGQTGELSLADLLG